MKISLLTQTLRSFFSGHGHQEKKTTDLPGKKKMIKYNSGKVKKDLKEKPYPVSEDEKFKNVSE